MTVGCCRQPQLLLQRVTPVLAALALSERNRRGLSCRHKLSILPGVSYPGKELALVSSPDAADAGKDDCG